MTEGVRAFDSSATAVRFEGTNTTTDGNHIYSSYKDKTYAIATGGVNWDYDIFTSQRVELKKGCTYSITYNYLLIRTADVDAFECAVGLAHYDAGGNLIVDFIAGDGAGEFTATQDQTYFVYIDGTPYSEFNITNVSIIKK